MIWMIRQVELVFQSTPPARGATYQAGPVVPQYRHFNPRPPRGGRRICSARWTPNLPFQSTPPARGATASPSFIPPTNGRISIHAPREGGDGDDGSNTIAHVISIHAPREGGDLRKQMFDKRFLGISIHAPREGGDSP